MSLLAAVAFLTILPLPVRWRAEPGQLARSVRWYPLVGGGIGLTLAGFDWLVGLALGGPVRDALVVLALVTISGALHLDGLMDTCDGVFAAVSPERRLEIMRDSHVGSFGVAAAGLVLLAEYAALASLGSTPRWAILVATAVLGRWAMCFAIAAFRAGRDDGLGRLVKDATGPTDLALAAATTVIVCGACLQAAGLLLVVLVTLVTWLIGRALLANLPGLTGDTYGALDVVAELTALALAPICVRLIA